MAAVAGPGFDKQRCLPVFLPPASDSHAVLCPHLPPHLPHSPLSQMPPGIVFLAGAACPSASEAMAQGALPHGAGVGLAGHCRCSSRWLHASCSPEGCEPFPLSQRDRAPPCPGSCLHTGGSCLCRAGAACPQHCLQSTQRSLLTASVSSLLDFPRATSSSQLLGFFPLSKAMLDVYRPLKNKK